MAKITTAGEFPKRIGDYVLYDLNGTTIIRVNSGFSTDALMTAPQYEACRQTASEFGRVSAFGKQWRMALETVLPKSNNLKIVNTLTQKMLSVLAFDSTKARGERLLSHALMTPEGRQFLEGYECNPLTQISPLFTLSGRILQLYFKKNHLDKETDYMAFRIHHLTYNFASDVMLLTSTSWCMEPIAVRYKTLELPMLPDTVAGDVLFVLLETQGYAYDNGSYVPITTHGGKSVLVVGVQKLN